MKSPVWIKDIMLLLGKQTYLPIPNKWQSDMERIPQAMRYQPLLGMLCGSATFGALRLFAVMPSASAAAVLVAIDLLLGGAFLLRDAMSVVDGRTQTEQNASVLDDDDVRDNETEIRIRQRRYNVGNRGLSVGLLYLVMQYVIFLMLARTPALGQTSMIVAPVVARFLLCWLVFGFPARPPGRLHRAMSRRSFYLVCLLTLLCIALFSRFALYIAFSVAFFAVYAFAALRVRSYGALDDACYGAAAAWSRIIFLLAWLAFVHFW